MKRIILSVLLVLSFVFVQVSSASTEADVQKVIKMIKASSGKNKLLTFEEYGNGEFKCSFIEGEKRYSVYYFPKPGDGWISFWVRPNGTIEKKFIKTFSDNKFDGIVDFGIGGGVDEQRYFDIKNKDNNFFQKYWQSLYDEAIADALRHFER